MTIVIRNIRSRVTHKPIDKLHEQKLSKDIKTLVCTPPHNLLADITVE